VLSWAALLHAACIVPAPSGEAARAASKLPPSFVPLNAMLAGKVELVRAVFRPGRLLPGEPVRAALVFRVLAPVDQEHLVFVHLEDADGRGERRNADHAPLGGARPMRTWRPGEYLTDEFTIETPPGVHRLLNVWVGLWSPEQDRRLPVDNPRGVRTDGRDRVLAGQLPVGLL
jgi:hypothetical protein